jgi:hypothetical protein
VPVLRGVRTRSDIGALEKLRQATAVMATRTTGLPVVTAYSDVRHCCPSTIR